MTEENKKILEEIAKKLLEKMGIRGDICIATDAISDEKNLIIEIQTDDSNFLIGKHGINLSAFQHMCRIIAHKKIGEITNFSVDVNNYRQNQIENIIQTAQNVINEVIDKNEEIALNPMNAYERRLVHIEVSKNDQVESESTGEGEERKIVIKPA